MDRERFARCAEENIDRIFRVACSYTENSADAEDVCRDTLLQLCRTAIAIRGGAIELQGGFPWSGIAPYCLGALLTRPERTSKMCTRPQALRGIGKQPRRARFPV